MQILHKMAERAWAWRAHQTQPDGHAQQWPNPEEPGNPHAQGGLCARLCRDTRTLPMACTGLLGLGLGLGLGFLASRQGAQPPQGGLLPATGPFHGGDTSSGKALSERAWTLEVALTTKEEDPRRHPPASDSLPTSTLIEPAPESTRAESARFEPALIGPTLWASPQAEPAPQAPQPTQSEPSAAAATAHKSTGGQKAASTESSGTRNAGPRQVLTQALEAIFEDESTRNFHSAWAAVKELAIQEAGGSTGSMPLAVVTRMVDAFRASRVGSRFTPMQVFIRAMAQAIDQNLISESHFDQLLRVWSWRWGDFRQAPGTLTAQDRKNGPHAVIELFIDILGKNLPAEFVLRRRVGTLCKEPEGIPGKGPWGEPTLMVHALWVVDGLMKLIIAKPLRDEGADSPRGGALDIDHTQRILRQFLMEPTTDLRWKPTIFELLGDKPPAEDPLRPLIPQAEWERLLVTVVKSYLNEVGSELRSPSTMNEAFSALADPAGYRQGRITDIRLWPRAS